MARKFAHHGYAAIAPAPVLPLRARRARTTSRAARAAGGRRLRRRGDGRRRRLHGVPARAAECQRQDRRHRLLLRRPPHLPRGLHAAGRRRGGRLLGRPRDRRRSEGVSPQRAGRADRPHAPSSPARCSASSATTTRTPTPTRSTGPRRSSRSTARPTNSTATTAPAIASSTTTGRPTGRSRPPTPGRRSSLSSTNIWRPRPAGRRRPRRTRSCAHTSSRRPR